MIDNSKKICIFVSQRIDLEAETVPNPIYFNVRCGAVFDNRRSIRMAGDDEGQNISAKRNSYCEFTVQYWAWKNVNAEYYGLCHYRRYLSFSPHQYKTSVYHMVIEPLLTKKAMDKYGLLDESAMVSEIRSYDIITSEPAFVPEIETDLGPQCNVKDLWFVQEGNYFEAKAFDLMLSLIREFQPQYYLSALEYFDGQEHRGFNCYVLQKELFDRLCIFQFTILNELEKRLDMSHYSGMMVRTPGYIGEMLYGVFMHHLIHHEKWRVMEKQLVYFEDAHRMRKPERIRKYILISIEHLGKTIVTPFAPRGSKTRDKIKKVYYRIAPSRRK